MNREIPFLDMRRSPGDIINCWIVYLMPFDSDERSDYDKIHAFQKACIDNNIFGMGWDGILRRSRCISAPLFKKALTYTKNGMGLTAAWNMP